MSTIGAEPRVADLRRRRFRASRYERIVKPMLDRTLSAVLLVVLSPVMLAFAVAIRLNSRGPILFRQQRVGQFGSRIGVIRYRVLRVDSESWARTLGHEPVTLPSDSADVTRVGRLLLDTRLDRLPMLLNVLGGQMSLVGPRAALPYELDHYGPVDWLRLRIKPGVACLWQLSGLPESDFRSAMALDQEYVNNLSPVLDLRIAARTLIAVAARGARH